MDRIGRFSSALTQKREALRASFVKGSWRAHLFELLSFGIKQAWACLFGATLLGLIIATYLFYPDGSPISRYDFLVLAAVLLQLTLLLSGLETMEEARVILVFHIVGTVMEVFKTQAGSWAYPEASLLRIGAVPLFSGFMYAAVGSYIARVWRIFEFRFSNFPPLWCQAILAVAIYINFFAHHYTVDICLGLYVLTVLIYGRCIIWFRPDRVERPMPLVIGFGLVALFIWFAENIGTLARAWTYPGQGETWHMVSIQKFGAWYLLMIISFVLVAHIHSGREKSA